MFNWLFNLFGAQAEYGVPLQPLYGVTPAPGPFDIFMVILKYAILPVILPLVLTIGVIVYMKKKAYPISKRICAVAIMLTIYFALFIGASFLFNWF